MNVFTKFLGNRPRVVQTFHSKPTNQRLGGTKGKIRESPKSLGYVTSSGDHECLYNRVVDRLTDRPLPFLEPWLKRSHWFVMKRASAAVSK